MTFPFVASDRISGVDVARYAAGSIWLAGAVFNIAVTRTMDAPYQWIVDDSPFPVYQWFFRDVVGMHPHWWTVTLAAGEAAIGGLTLVRGRAAQIGLAGGAVFSIFLFGSGMPYTLIMGPYAFALAWLAHRIESTRLRRTRMPSIRSA